MEIKWETSLVKKENNIKSEIPLWPMRWTNKGSQKFWEIILSGEHYSQKICINVIYNNLQFSPYRCWKCPPSAVTHASTCFFILFITFWMVATLMRDILSSKFCFSWSNCVRVVLTDVILQMSPEKKVDGRYIWGPRPQYI